MSLKLREYQEEALSAVFRALNQTESQTRQLIVLPTGTGKTIIFGAIIRQMKVRTLVLAHREELLRQAEQKIKLVYPEANIGFLQAQDLSGLKSEICIASVQTAVRHLEELQERGFELCICDEAHHAVASSYVRIFKELDFLKNIKTRVLIGFTATPYRNDKLGLKHIFGDTPVFERSIAAMTEAGYLCRSRGIEILTNTDISGVKIQAGEYSQKELAVVVDTPERNALIADKYLELGEGRRGVVFCVDVAHAHNVAAAFNQRGVECGAVWGNMSNDRRHEVLNDYMSGRTQILTNVGVLTEGWDVPETDIIMMARPIKSAGLYVQCIGRGLRKAPNKEDCLILDFVDIARKHNVCKFSAMDGLCPSFKIKAKNNENNEDNEDGVSKHEHIAMIREGEGGDFDVVTRSKYPWQRVGDDLKISLWNGNTLWIERRDDGYRPVIKYSDGKFRLLADIDLTFSYAYGVCNDYIDKHHLNAALNKEAKWRKLPATDKQLDLLRRNNIEFSEKITRGEASDLLNKPTPKQLSYIKYFRLHDVPESLTKNEAAAIIGTHKDIMHTRAV